MGSSPSKDGGEIAIDDNPINDSDTPAAPFEPEKPRVQGTSEDRGPGTKKMLETPTQSATPRTNPKLKGGFGGKNRAERQPADRRDDVTTPSHITDDQVHVNLAMADLMAYLQVVANNSNNLPLTRRDDPELGRMVSNLTSEEYARKSAAFIPADVRVIGGTFTKYGRVWDLPTSDEYNVSDGAQEPGRSYGGACSNALLKVLYDAANEATDAAQTMEANQALFDDDEDEESSLSTAPAFTRNSTFASLDMNGHFNPSTLTWADLMRKMKGEMKDIGYAQVPTLTATRKFDLNQAFSLVPDSFDTKTGKKRSLLIGCNYNHIDGAQLKASHDDVRSMKDYIVNVHGFPENDDMMTVLLDDDEHKHPTFLNITEAFKALSEQSQPGDAVFIQFSGHGGRVLDSPANSEEESYDEVIVPSDYTTSGLIRDTLIFKTLLAPMRYGVTVTVIIDACDTGMVLDLPYTWSTKSDKAGMVKMTQNDDFSFVRFLKVVKTLYESSTFTQLGRTVGSALHNGNKAMDDDDETHGLTDTSRHSRGTDEDDLTRVGIHHDEIQPSFMNFFGACASPQEELVEDTKLSKPSKKSGRCNATVDTRDVRAQPSLLEQMMTCGLGQDPDELSDEDSYKSQPSYDEEHELEDSTYDSMDEDERYESAKRRGRSRRRRA